MQRGVQFDVAGQRHELRFDINAICQMEADFGDLSIDEIVPLLGVEGGAAPKMHNIRRAFRAGLVGNLTAEDAGNIMSDLTLPEACRLIGEALALSMPAAPKDETANRAARRAGKPKAAA